MWSRVKAGPGLLGAHAAAALVHIRSTGMQGWCKLAKPRQPRELLIGALLSLRGLLEALHGGPGLLPQVDELCAPKMWALAASAVAMQASHGNELCMVDGAEPA